MALAVPLLFLLVGFFTVVDSENHTVCNVVFAAWKAVPLAVCSNAPPPPAAFFIDHVTGTPSYGGGVCVRSHWTNASNPSDVYACVCTGYSRTGQDAEYIWDNIPPCTREECFGIGKDNDTCKEPCGEGLVFDDYGNCVETCSARAPYLYNNTQCTIKCPKKSYIDDDDAHKCFPCHSECKLCFGPSEAECKGCMHVEFEGRCLLKCPPDALTNGNTCVYICPHYRLGKICVDQCPINYYANATKYCLPCHIECEGGCTGPGNDQCKSCKHLRDGLTCVHVCPHERSVVYNKQCLKECPGVWYQDHCLEQCPNATVWVGFNHSCVHQCPKEASFIYNDTCVSSCPVLSFGSHCVNACPEYANLIYNGACIAVCPRDHIYVNDTRCIRSCNKLHYKHHCVDKCPGELPNYQGACVLQCPTNNSLVDPVTKACTHVCSHFIYKDQCLSTCPRPLYKFNHSCVVQCPESTFTSDNDTECVEQCPFFHYRRRCYTECPEGLFRDNVTCTDKCPDIRRFVVNDTCATSCPTRMVRVPNTTRCLSSCPRNLKYRVSGMCLSSCPENRPLTLAYGGVACFSTCPSPYLRIGQSTLCQDVSECPEDFPYKTISSACVQTCSSGEYPNSKTYVCEQRHVFSLVMEVVGIIAVTAWILYGATMVVVKTRAYKSCKSKDNKKGPVNPNEPREERKRTARSRGGYSGLQNEAPFVYTDGDSEQIQSNAAHIQMAD
ncbi:proprotein convertase subtilisin/kexin type 5 [Lingula anatina]|uniref:Proprotein convertase subtilisin/kexin type 5 n=1 Tax=Lingula anatina TaxID=7574 RepID=A0A1S3HC70_LINAN|nr:proprotein convertase subtilisin/kexin type 5 [Lingula anatina]XP_013382763.1 proprotein convertase subtilisin/kexin type 5 [Lingula anatina]|eukprot:XP_013382754.1 proprotein convertase subtilisin/kexin type 5 [Lingula anatina]